MSLSNYGEQVALEAALEGTYIALVTTTPTDTNPGTEVTAAEYARRPWTVGYTQGNPTEATNTNNVEFPGATSNWGMVSHAVVYDALTGGNYLGYMEFRDPNDTNAPLAKSVTSGDIVRFNTGTLIFRLD